MENITWAIRETAYGFIRCNGKDPQCLYLGKIEARELFSNLKEQVKDPKPELGNRPKFDGMLIYRVDADSHIAVS